MVVATDATKHHLSLERETFSSPLIVGKLPLRGGAMFERHSHQQSGMIPSRGARLVGNHNAGGYNFSM
jgi:hypothetical protein